MFSAFCAGTSISYTTPVDYYLVLSACGIQESDVKIKETAANSVTLSSAIMCVLQNPKASPLHYRISAILSNPQSARKVKAFVDKLLLLLPRWILALRR